MKRLAWLVVGLVFLYFFLKVGVAQIRSIRNNNPGNLRPLPRGVKWNGELANDISKGGPFSRFDTPRNGWRAFSIDVYGDILRDKLDTIRKLVNSFAPATDNNDPLAYANVVAKKVGIDLDFPLNVWLHGPTLLKAMADHEAGINTDLVWGSGPRKQGIADATSYLQAAGRL